MVRIKLKKSKGKGRGVFAESSIKKGQIIETCPVIVLPKKDTKLIEKTGLYDYYFGWGKGLKESAIALGYGSLYNHSFDPNALYIKDFKKELLIFKARRNIKKGEEILVNYNGDPLSQNPMWFKVK
ncbi:MAG: SET domain-containing protein [Candidatus Colwellbacteria bacterium]|nr:SET domain-containing protein [Candidatus Colwellbacteria bacterium]